LIGSLADGDGVIACRMSATADIDLRLIEPALGILFEVKRFQATLHFAGCVRGKIVCGPRAALLACACNPMSFDDFRHLV